MTPPLETPRLLLRPLELADADQIQAIFPHIEVVRYLANKVPWPYPPDGALTFVRDVALPAIRRGDWWQWTLRLKTSPQRIIGNISLMRGEDNNRGFWLGKDWHRQGFMTEAVIPVTDFWFDTLGFSVMRVPKAAPNAGSRRISEKQGMRIVRMEDRDYVGGRFPSEVWELTAADWRRYRSAAFPA